ncbi:MAG: N-acetylneuraminate synthase family protein [Bacteroidota bacterium]|nr:N-acetylneuraminate synthase family protein [Bacteroidota bacterium]
MSIEKKILGADKCFIIAEVAQAHDGSLGTAHAFIDAAKHAGADSIKFQTHIASEESTLQEQWRVKFSYQDVTRYDYWKRMEFTEEQWAGLKKHAEDNGLVFLSSPFSVKAVEMLDKMGMEAWKIASGEITNLPMLEQIFKTRKPLLISSGMSDLEETESLVEKIRSNNIPFALLQCTSSYPTPPEKVGLNVMEEFRSRFECPVGLSDHSGKINPALAAATLGMNVLEVHITLDRYMFGPDVVASVTTEEFRQMTEGVRFIEAMMSSPVLKDKTAGEMKTMRNLFNKSIVARSSIAAGTILEQKHLAFKKPGIGMPAAMYKDVIGKKLLISVEADHFFSKEDIS